MKLTYSGAFIEQALVKVFSRKNKTIQSVAEELNVNHYTLKHWMREAVKKNLNTPVVSHKEKRPQDWRAEDQLLALQETHGLEGEALNAWCRERGIFAHHLSGWKAAFCKEQKSTAPAPASPGEMRGLQEENKQLKRELGRKEKALAEAAALLVLQKKFRALWGDEAT